MPSTCEICSLSLHDALPIYVQSRTRIRSIDVDGGYGYVSQPAFSPDGGLVRSEEHTSELQSLRHLVCRLPARFALFPYTTLFRSTFKAVPEFVPSMWTVVMVMYPSLRSVLTEDWSDRKSTRLNSSHLGISYAVYLRDLLSFPTRRSSDLRSKPYQNSFHRCGRWLWLCIPACVQS